MITLVPAYGRDYKSAKAAEADWQAGKDFQIAHGPYTSIRDKASLVDMYGGISIRYDRLRKQTIVA